MSYERGAEGGETGSGGELEWWKAEGGRQRVEGRGWKAEGGRQRVERL
jgi:hypothetical protein